MQRGFTLLEAIVTISIIVIITYLVLAAFPVARSQQALLRAENQFQNHLRIAQTEALNEVRSAECLDRVGPSPTDQKRCSDIGVYVAGNMLTRFADISDDNLYTSADFQLEMLELPANVTVQADRTFLFEATPPNITLYANGVVVTPDVAGDATFRAGAGDIALTVSPYGHVGRSE